MVAKVPAAGVDLTTESSITLKNPATADNSTFTLNLQTAEADIAQDDVLGKINFQAPNEGTGTDAILVAASIQATSEGDFSSSSNATKLEFMTGSSEAATSQMTISSGGIVGIGATLPGDLGTGLHIKTADSSASAHADADELVIEGSANSGMSVLSGTSGYGTIYFGDSGDDNIGAVQYEHSSNSLYLVTSAATALKIDSTGAVTKPLQPAVLAVPNATQNDVATGWVTIVFGSEVYDVNADFNTSTSTFTAPITGKYMVTANVDLTDIDTATQWMYGGVFVTSNRTYYMNLVDPTKEYSADNNSSFSSAAIVDMDASDTLLFKVRTSAHGAAQMNVTYGSGETWLSICLIA